MKFCWDLKKLGLTLGFVLATAAQAQNLSIMDAKCSSPLRVSFWGDFFLNAKYAENASVAEALPLLRWGDANVANFEGNVGDTTFLTREYPSLPYALLMPPNALDILRMANVKYVTRANNHSMDFGAKGMRHTSKILQKNKIEWAGVGENSHEATRPITLEKNGVRIALFSFATTWPEQSWANSQRPGIAYPTLERIQISIKEARQSHDFVVAAFHWGGELTTEIQSYQDNLANVAFEAGADLVYGHHAHMMQGIEKRKSKTLAWGLGNFLFSSLGKQTNMSIGMHSEFCKEVNKKNIQIVFSPLETGGKKTLNSILPLTLEQFQKHSRKLYGNNLVNESTMFYILERNKTQSYHDWNRQEEKSTPAQLEPAITPPPS